MYTYIYIYICIYVYIYIINWVVFSHYVVSDNFMRKGNPLIGISSRKNIAKPFSEWGPSGACGLRSGRGRLGRGRTKTSRTRGLPVQDKILELNWKVCIHLGDSGGACASRHTTK